MHIGPRADANCIDGFVFEDFQPIFANLLNTERISNFTARCDRPVRHRRQLNAFEFLEAWNVTVPHITTGADEPEANFFECHVEVLP